MDERQVFQEEAGEILDGLEGDILELRGDLGNQGLISKIFRGLHTIKGSGAMFGFDHIATFAHRVEDVVDAIRRGEVEMSEPFLDLLLACRDHLLALLRPEMEQCEETERLLLASLEGYLPPEKGNGADAASPRLNCWEYFKCGREKECPAGIYTEFNGMNSGQCGGRICWVVSGTRCENGLQGDYFEKFYERCKDCEFRLLVKRQEGKNLSTSVSIYRTLRKVAVKKG